MESNLQYADKDYWDKRFENEAEFEWLTDFEAFKRVILPFLRPEHRILHIGCGNSQLSMRLYEMGFKNIVNLDYSEVLVAAMQEKHPEMEWVCDDIRSMDKIADGSVDVVLEKATIEALLVAEKSPWSPSDSALSMLDSVFSSAHRVLSPTGVWLSVSFTQPHFRVPALLRRDDWRVTVDQFGDMFHYYVFACRKGETTSDEVRARHGAMATDWLRPL